MNQRTPIFFTADLHIGHEGVLNFCPGRGETLADMHSTIIKRFNSTVPEDAVVWFLGDVGLCSSAELKDLLSKLKCKTKVLILGNHDLGVNAMYAAGFDVVLHNATMQIAGQTVSLSHCPLLGAYRENTKGMRGNATDENWHGESRSKMRKFTMIDNGQFHLHGHIHCLSEDTEILTLNGWKHYGDIVKGDMTLTRNTGTGIDSWEYIDKLITSDYSGKLMHMNSEHVSQLITNGHNLLINDRKDPNKTQLTTYEDLPYTINTIPVTSNISNSGMDVGDDFLRLLVWITTDGSIEPNGSGIRWRFKKKRKIIELSRLLTSLGCIFTHRIRKCGVETIRFNYKKEFKGELLEYFNIYKKELPKQLENANYHQSTIILDTYEITDGCRTSKNSIQISSAKKQEIELLQLLFFKNGLCAKMSKKKNRNHYMLHVNINRKNTSVHKTNNFKETTYDGTVWCIQVPNQNFVVRHNGCISFTGNSPNGGKSETKLGRQWDIGLDGNKMTPVSLSQVESWIVKTLADERRARQSDVDLSKG